MRGRTRLADVARQAGVSVATVSRVLNGKPGVSEGTRSSVLAALEAHDYQRQDRPRLRGSGLIGLIVGEMSNPIFPAFAQGVEHCAASVGYTPLLCTGSPGGISEDDYLDTLLEHGVDGIVVVSGAHADTEADAARYHRLRERQVPLVLINGTREEIGAPTLSTDDRMAMDLAVRHLFAQGHRRIGLAMGPERYVPAARKRAGFLEAMARHVGATTADCPVVNTLFTLEGGVQAGYELIEAGCTAVICGSDVMALGVVKAARLSGQDVPHDLSVVGFDDTTLVGYTNPPLTTLRQPVAALCQAAVSTLIAQIAGEPVPGRELLYEPELILRGSTGAAPGSAHAAVARPTGAVTA